MGEVRDALKSVYRQPWFYSILLLTTVPLFPGYLSFPLVIISFCLCCCDAKKRGDRIRFGKIGKMLLIYFAYLACSLFYTADLEGSFWTLMMWLCMFLGYLTAATVLYTRERLRISILCMTMTTGAVGSIAVFQFVLREWFNLNVDDMLWEQSDRFVYGLLNISVSEVNFGSRVSSTFNNPNLMAAYLALTIPFAIAFVLTGARSKPKALARIALIAAVYALGFSYCRAGYLALLVVAGLLGLMYIRKRFLLTALTVVYVVLLVPSSVGNRLLSVIPTAPDQPADTIVETIPEDAPPMDLPEKLEQIEQEVTTRYEKDGSVSERFLIWQQAVKSIKEHPLFGLGFGVQTTNKMLHANNLPFKHAHNLFLEILCEGGIVSLLMFAGILYLLCMRGVRLLRQRGRKEAWLLGFAVFGACGALLVFGVFDFPLMIPRLISTCMLLMGMTESTARLYLFHHKREQSSSSKFLQKIRQTSCNLCKK